jgi:hypothetical protein
MGKRFDDVARGAHVNLSDDGTRSSRTRVSCCERDMMLLLCGGGDGCALHGGVIEITVEVYAMDATYGLIFALFEGPPGDDVVFDAPSVFTQYTWAPDVWCRGARSSYAPFTPLAARGVVTWRIDGPARTAEYAVNGGPWCVVFRDLPPCDIVGWFLGGGTTVRLRSVVRRRGP